MYLIRFYLLSFVAIIFVSFCSLQYGVINLNLSAFWQVLSENASNQEGLIAYKIIVDLRMPRVLTALMVGAGLGLVGLLLQTITNNSLADPFLFGLSSGAATGAVIAITLTGNIWGLWTLPIFAFIGGIFASLCVLGLIQKQHLSTSQNIVLIGLIVSFLFSALTNYLVFSGDQHAAHSILFWSLGGFGLAKWENLFLAVAGLSAIICFVLIKHRDLDALLAGEETAQSLGVNVFELRRNGFIVAAFSTACFVALVGVIAFVGLMVPHIARMLKRRLHQDLLWITLCLGAFLMISSDLTSRLILAPQELPIGIVTTFLGAVFMLFLLFKKA